MKQNTILESVQQSTVDARREKERLKSEMFQSIYVQKHEIVVATRKQSEKNDINAKVFKEKVVKKNQEKSQKIKHQEELVIVKRKEEFANKLVQNKLDYEQRLLDEEIRKQAREAEVLKMEQLEMELIKRLQHTQGIQKNAFEELESALAQAPQEFAKKYFNEDGSEALSPAKSPKSKKSLGRLGSRGEADAFGDAAADSGKSSKKVINDQVADQQGDQEAQVV